MLKTVVLVLGVSCFCLAKDCCVPDQWEGSSRLTAGSIKNGQPTVSVVDIRVHYDLTNMRAAFEETITANGFIVPMRVIQMMKMGVEYTIAGNSCSKKSIPTTPLNRCVPSSATFDGQHFIVDGKNNVTVNTYKYQGQGITALVSMTGSCEPVGQVSYGIKNGIQFLTNSNYYDITPGIKDPSVFNIPSICSYAKFIPGDKSDASTKGLLGF